MNDEIEYLRRKIAEAQEQLQRFVAASPALLYVLQVTDRGLRLTWISENLHRLTGWTTVDSLNWNDWWVEKIHADDRARVLGLQADSQDLEHLVLEYRLRRGDGTYMFVRDEKRMLRNANGGTVEIVGTWVDISAQKRLEAQFIQAQKMEAIGALAGGVAHDFNNLLTVIRGYTTLLIQDFDPEDPRRRDLELVEKAAQQAASLTSQLLAFSRKQILRPEILNLNETVMEMAAMLRRLIGEDVVLTVDTQPDLGLINADPGQIQQIIMNLAVNARDAMPNGGKLTIKTANVDLGDEFIREYPMVKRGPYVLLTISDNGIGMDAKTLARIFEPFFTTKEKGKGTGLGLSTVYGIVKQSEGFIWVKSQPGEGTTFEIYFPRTEGEIRKMAPEAALDTESPVSETVLVVEDEASVRALTCRMLRQRGYTILEASDGKEALDAVRGYAGDIHLVLADVVMPEMGGRHLVSRLQAERPGIRALYMSGYTDDAIVHHGILDSNVAFIQKPFTMETLARKIHEVIHSGG